MDKVSFGFLFLFCSLLLLRVGCADAFCMRESWLVVFPRLVSSLLRPSRFGFDLGITIRFYLRELLTGEKNYALRSNVHKNSFYFAKAAMYALT
ncbi:MAG: hypothetical protein C4308_08470 [Chitinophagaceae bacterium]